MKQRTLVTLRIIETVILAFVLLGKGTSGYENTQNAGDDSTNIQMCIRDSLWKFTRIYDRKVWGNFACVMTQACLLRLFLALPQDCLLYTSLFRSILPIVRNWFKVSSSIRLKNLDTVGCDAKDVYKRQDQFRNFRFCAQMAITSSI